MSMTCVKAVAQIETDNVGYPDVIRWKGKNYHVTRIRDEQHVRAFEFDHAWPNDSDEVWLCKVETREGLDFGVVFKRNTWYVVWYE